jgi:hypothetical protein
MSLSAVALTDAEWIDRRIAGACLVDDDQSVAADRQVPVKGSC